jgi:spermidine synthase
VAIQNGKYVLNANNANYSFATLHRVFQQALEKINIQNRQHKSVLLLGCGAGSIPTIFYDELQLYPAMDAVEIDEKVIELGKNYFDLDKFEKLNVIIDDATSFVQSSKKKYDLILIDLFDGINVPTKFLSKAFFEKLKPLLNDNGELLLNFVAYNHETKQLVDPIKKKLEDTFSTPVEVFQLEGINRVFHLKK